MIEALVRLKFPSSFCTEVMRACASWHLFSKLPTLPFPINHFL